MPEKCKRYSVSNGEFTGFARVRHQQRSRECRFASECESGDEDQYQETVVQLTLTASIMARNANGNAAENGRALRLKM